MMVSGEPGASATGGASISTTLEHPFYVDGKGWTLPGELRIGDRIPGLDPRESVAVRAISATRRDAKVYNLRVADYHTYFVQAPGGGAWLWAHNAYAVYQQQVKGKPRYFGRTANFVRRAAEHARKGRDVEQIGGLGRLTYKRMRATEHLLIEKCGRRGIEKGGILDNKLRGIDPAKLGKYTKELRLARRRITMLGL